MPAKDYYLPGRALVEQQQSQLIEPPPIPRSKFHNRWNRLTTFDAGYLVPFMWEEVLPGDHWNINAQAFIRMSPVIFPIFSNLNLQTFFFFVPLRLLQTNFVKMMGEQLNPGDSVAVAAPNMDHLLSGDITVGSIWDYLNVPPVFGGGVYLVVNAYAPRAYNMIWNQWFRDENLQNSVATHTDDGPDPKADYALLRVAKYHDRFTSALPWTQKFTSPVVPLTGWAPLSGIGFASPLANDVAGATWYESLRGPTVYGHAQSTTTQALGMRTDAANGNILAVAAMDPTVGGTITPPGDTGAYPGFIINAFRSAFMIQSLYERDARGGTRYIEHLKSEWGVDGQDYRLQRPEYIGGGTSPVMVTPVAQTAPSAISGSVGSLGAAGTASGRHSASYAAVEHGIIMGLMAIRSELAYQTGLAPKHTRGTRLTFYNPALAQLGEQPILNQEIYSTNGMDAGVFGYQESWHEYRTHTSEVTGYFRSIVGGTLDAWHLAQAFGGVPTLNTTFIQETPPVSRVLAAGAGANNQQFIGDIMIEATTVRPLPAYGTPALLGRF